MRTFLRLVGRGLKDLTLYPFALAFTLTAVTLAAFLCGLFLLLLHNLNLEMREHRGQVTYQIYWKADADQSAVSKQWAELAKAEGVVTFHTYTPDQAMAELLEAFGRGGSDLPKQMSGGKNPLPATAVLTLAPPRDDENFAKAMHQKLSELPGVAEVHVNPLEVNLAASWIRFSRSFAWPLIVLLALVAGLIAGNTIKLAQYARRDEVEILRLVGATQSYIELPLLSGGAALGLVGGGLALVFLKLVQLGLAPLLSAPPLLISMEFLPPLQALGLLGGLTLVCMAASFAAVRD